jgi:hypothetical protein
VQKGYLDSLINKKKQDFSVDDQIAKKTIQNRRTHGIISTTHPGAKPPLQDAEQALVKICVQMGRSVKHSMYTKAIH